MFTFKIEKDGDKWHAWCPELKGCHTFGDTQKEAFTNLKDAMNLYLEDVFEEKMLSSMTENHSLQHA